MCVVVQHQPGAVSRLTQYGTAEVCNATVRQGSVTIRCSFWRNLAAALATHAVGSTLALHQVTVKKIGTNNEWELRGTEATDIEVLQADDLRSSMLAETDLTQGPSLVLTTHRTVDYNSVEATPSCAGSLTSLLVPDAARDLGGVYEVHSVTILGFTSVLQDEGFCMASCAMCMKQVAVDTNHCAVHPDAEIQLRWLAKMSFADHSGSAEAMIYHEALASTDLVPATVAPLSPAQVTALNRKVR